MAALDLSLVEDDGRLVVHRADCPEVERRRQLGEPIATFLDCERVPAELELAPCLAPATPLRSPP
jgi:hypothetical protein